MSESLELKNLMETTARTIEAIRSEVSEVKSADVVTETKLSKMEKDLATALEAKSAMESRLVAVENAAARPGATKSNVEQDEYKSAFLTAIRKPNDMNAQNRAQELSVKADMLTSADTSGGLAIPTSIADGIYKGLSEVSPVIGLVKNINISTPDFKILVDANNAEALWSGELPVPRPETDAPTLSEKALTGGEIFANCGATTHSLQDLAFDVESWIVSSVTEKFAEKIAAAIWAGTGATGNQPTGILTATGVNQLVTGDATGLGTAFDSLLAMPFATKSGYRKNGTFVVNTATLASLVRVKDQNGAYLYQNSVIAGIPGTLLGYRVETDENVAAVAGNSVPVVFGDFSKYTLAHRTGINVLVDPYIKKGAVYFYISKRIYGNVVDPSAFVTLRVATA